MFHRPRSYAVLALYVIHTIISWLSSIIAHGADLTPVEFWFKQKDNGGHLVADIASERFGGILGNHRITTFDWSNNVTLVKRHWLPPGRINTNNLPVEFIGRCGDEYFSTLWNSIKPQLFRYRSVDPSEGADYTWPAVGTNMVFNQYYQSEQDLSELFGLGVPDLTFTSIVKTNGTWTAYSTGYKSYVIISETYIGQHIAQLIVTNPLTHLPSLVATITFNPTTHIPNTITQETVDEQGIRRNLATINIDSYGTVSAASCDDINRALEQIAGSHLAFTFVGGTLFQIDERGTNAVMKDKNVTKYTRSRKATLQRLFLLTCLITFSGMIWILVKYKT